jgi:hypothetical protein
MRFEGNLTGDSLAPSVSISASGPAIANRGTYLSPALARRFGGPPAYEIKFRLEPSRAQHVEEWARRHMAFDPYADPAHDYAYRVHTLYLDTPRLDMFRRVPGHKRHKFRLRRYGTEPVVFLERKSKTDDWVAKRRTKVDAGELMQLFVAPADPAWAGHWFRRRLAFRGLRPTCRMSYDRVAHVGPGPNGLLRLTLDRQVQCAPADGWTVGEIPGARPALNVDVIVELKYRAAMPAVYKGLLASLGLCPRQTSKYRLGIAAWESNGAKEAG